MTILVKRLKGLDGKPLIELPYKKRDTDGGWDLFMPVAVQLNPGQSVFFKSCYCVALPLGWTGLIRPRSSTYAKRIVTNGTIDCGYTGEIVIGLENRSDEVWQCAMHDRIVQMIPVFTGSGVANLFRSVTSAPQGMLRVMDVLTACEEMEEVDEMPETDRGDKGFGSSGK